MNLLTVAKTFATEDMALAYLVMTRWPDGVRCLACDSAKCYTLTTKGKTGKKIHLFECGDCGLHFSATTGTLFHDSHLPLTKWFAAMALMAEAKKGISANQVARHIGCSYKTAWYLCHRIRKAMQELNAPALGGPGKVVEVDETFVGGKMKRKGLMAAHDAKIKVLGIAERGGRVHLQTIENTKAEAIRPALEAKLHPDTDKVVTDQHLSYYHVIPKDKHEPHSHKKELDDEGSIWSTRCIETAFSLFKRGLVGSYHKMSRDHMDSYLQEFCWRFNRRHMQPWMFDVLLREVANGKPLTYKKLTRETF
jgi:transposase-like protein